MATELETSIAEVIAVFSQDGAVFIHDAEKKRKPASALQIACLLWGHFMPTILGRYSDNDIRQLAYSEVPEVRRFVADLAVLQARDLFNKPPLEPGETLSVDAGLRGSS